MNKNIVEIEKLAKEKISKLIKSPKNPFPERKLITKYPKELSEAEIQAILYNKLKESGFNVRLEISCINNKKKSIFDVVVYTNLLDKPTGVLIIEVKKASSVLRKQAHKSLKKQARKYAEYDADLIYCVGESDIISTVDKVKRFMSTY